MGETIADRVLGHRLQPETPHRLVGFGMLGDVTEDQLPFAARVTGIDEAGHVFAFDEPGEQLEPVGCLVDRVQCEMWRNHRQMGERPFASLDFVFFRHGQLEQVADGRGEHELLALEVIAFAGEASQGTGDVLGDGRFFGDD